MTKTVSVALATYNGANFLRAQLDSIASQTKTPDELVVTDDCSTDNTVDIVREFAKTVSFPVVIHINEKTVGYTQNFSRALSLCSGDIVFLSDQDDVWLPNKVDSVVNIFKALPKTLLVIHDVEYCKHDLTAIGQTKIQRMSTSFDLNNDYVVGMATAVIGSFLDICLPIPTAGGITHDSWLHQCATLLCGKIIIPDVLALHRRHDGNATASSLLNVDYVTPKDHFKNRTRTYDLYFRKTDIHLLEDSEVVRWLKVNVDKIICRGFCDEKIIKKIIEENDRMIDCVNKRYRLLKINRLKRIYLVAQLYLNGGYRYYAGWKSAIKDLLFN